jgi:hypothetical protein
LLLVDLGDELFVGWDYAEVFLFHEEFEVGEDFFFPFVAVLTGIIVHNFFVLLLWSSRALLAISYGVISAYFVSAVFFARTEMKQFTREWKIVTFIECFL